MFLFFLVFINFLLIFYVVKKIMFLNYIYNKKEIKFKIKFIFKVFCFVFDIINDFVIFLYDFD